MTCLHGLEEINCPICRINASTIPKESFKVHDIHHNKLKPYYHESTLREDVNKRISTKFDQQQKLLRVNSINPIPEMKTLNEIPNLKNKMFEERLNELSFNKSNTIKLLKRVPLENPDWKIEE